MAGTVGWLGWSVLDQSLTRSIQYGIADPQESPTDG
jgi:hypothetical protein